jgi:hypothetical protein
MSDATNILYFWQANILYGYWANVLYRWRDNILYGWQGQYSVWMGWLITCMDGGPNILYG